VRPRRAVLDLSQPVGSLRQGSDQLRNRCAICNRLNYEPAHIANAHRTTNQRKEASQEPESPAQACHRAERPLPAGYEISREDPGTSLLWAVQPGPAVLRLRCRHVDTAGGLLNKAVQAFSETEHIPCCTARKKQGLRALPTRSSGAAASASAASTCGPVT
jgi:hypothetical protein